MHRNPWGQTAISRLGGGSSRTGASSRGFSLLEALISAVVLGIALLGVIQLHTTSIRGTEQAEDIGRAAEVARQFADRLAMEVGTINTTHPCYSNAAPATPGCRENVNAFRTGNAAGNNACSTFVANDATPDTTGVVVSLNEATDNWQYRIDTLVSDHPDGGTGVMLLDVFVCWRNMNGLVGETRTSRVVVDGMM